MAVQWDKENGLNGWGVDFWNTIRGVKKDLPGVNEEIKKFIETNSKFFEGVDAQNAETLRPQLIQDADELLDITDELREDFADFISTTDLSGDIMEQYQTHLINSANNTSRFASFTKKAGSVIKSFGASIVSMGVNMAIGMIVDTIATAIDNYANRVKYAQERLDEFNNTVSESKNDLETQKKWIEEHGERYEELARGVDNYGHNVSLTTDEFSEYQSITKDIADMFPSMISGYNDQNNAIVKMKGNVDELTESYKANVEAAYASILANSSEGFVDYKTAIEDAEKVKEDVEHIISANKITRTVDSNGGDSFKIDDKIVDIKEILSDDEYREFIQKEVLKFDMKADGSSVVTEFNFNDLSAGMQQKIRAILTTANATIKTETAKVKPILESFVYGNEGKDSGYDSLDDEGKQIIRNVISSLDDTFYEQFDTDTDMVSYFYSNFIDPLKNGLDNTDLAVKINTLFSLNQNDYESYQDYVNAVNEIINQIKNLEGHPYSEEQIDGLKNILGIGKVNNGGQLSGQSLIDTVKGKYSSIGGADEFIKTLNEKELRVLYDLKPDESKSLGNLKQAVESLNKEASDFSNETTVSTPLTFKEVWDSIGTTGDDDAKKAALEEKKRLEELAKEGKLTEKELSKSSIADEFTNAGVSIAKATKEINKFKSSADQLASMKTGISSISSVLGEKKENLSSKKTRNEGIGADTLAGMPEDVKAQTKEYEHFVEVLGNGSSTMDKCRDAANRLATAYVNSSNFLAKLTPETVDYYTSVLKQMGVENASEVVKNALAKQTYALRLERLANSNATKEEIAALQEEAGQYGITSAELANYVLQKKITNNNALDTSKSINNLISLAKQCGATSKVIIALQNLLQSTSELEDLYQKDLTDFTSNVTTDLQHAPDAASNEKSEAIGKASAKISTDRKKLLKLIKDSTKIGANINVKPTNTSGSKKDKSGKAKKTKETKQEINWLERRLTRMQNIIDLTASKLQNLFSVKAKNSNLNKQIKQSTALMNQYGIAAKRYQDKADSIAKGKKKGKKKTKELSKSIIKKIKSGKITKADYSELIKKYGQSDADRINSYIDYYDKAQDAKKNKQDTKAKIRELQIQKWQNIQEDADKKIEKYQAQRENALLKDKNNTIKSQIDEIKRSYNAQIEIAKLEEDTVTEAKLRAEKQKALNDLYQEEIDNIKANTDAKIKVLDIGTVDKNGKRTYGRQYYDNQISYTEATGGIVDKQWYREQNKLRDSEIKEAQIGLNQLITKIGNFDEGTQKWYDLQSDRADYEKVINDAKIAQIENTKAMRSLTEAMEEKYDQWYSNFNSELSFLSSLQSGDHADSDSGTFTDSGNLALYTQALTFKSANAEKDYWRDQTTALKGLIDRKASIEEIKSAGFEFESLEDAEKALDDYYQKWQDSISTEKSAEEAIVDLMKEKYEAQKDYLQDIIDAKKEALEIEKD